MKTYSEFYVVQICFIHMQKEKQCGVIDLKVPISLICSEISSIT